MEKRIGSMENLVINKNFWNNKKVFITGHTGFKGSWLSVWLESLGAKVTGFSHKRLASPNLFEVARIDKVITNSIFGDLRDLQTIKKALVQSKPDIVIHLAAQSLVRYSYENPVETYATNVMGLVNLFEAVKSCSSVRSLLNITTDKCYENKEWLWPYRENDPMGGLDPYSNSKACSELITNAYRHSFFNYDDMNRHGVGLASARAGNVIGQGDWAEDRLIPDIFRALDKKKPVNIRFPNAIRPWQHVLEPLAGYLLLSENLYKNASQYADSWNFGPKSDDTKSVQWVVQYIIDNLGFGEWLIEDKKFPHEANLLKLDSTKARVVLGWKPQLSIEKSLDSIIHWHKLKPHGADARNIMLNQIKNYSSIKK
jgi:CDP-glucose 4,6-dehydratase